MYGGRGGPPMGGRGRGIGGPGMGNYQWGNEGMAAGGGGPPVRMGRGGPPMGYGGGGSYAQGPGGVPPGPPGGMFQQGRGGGQGMQERMRAPGPSTAPQPSQGPGPVKGPGAVPVPTQGGGGRAPPGQGPVRYANDCEIVVTAKAQQQYAEMIESAIKKDMGLKVDLMFPKPDVRLVTFIENIAAMGTIFAVVIRPDNEAHRSVSVHVLRGCEKAEEHRNMPLVQAYQLIKDRYLQIKRKEVGVVPDIIKQILQNLLNELTLSDKEYLTVIKFLQDRRRKLKAFENRTNNIVKDGEDDLVNNPDADELKQRILSIMSGKTVTSTNENLGDLLVPKPKEPLGSLGNESAAGPFPHGAAGPGPSVGRGMGVARGQGQGYRF